MTRDDLDRLERLLTRINGEAEDSSRLARWWMLGRCPGDDYDIEDRLSRFRGRKAGQAGLQALALRDAINELGGEQ